MHSYYSDNLMFLVWFFEKQFKIVLYQQNKFNLTPNLMFFPMSLRGVLKNQPCQIGLVFFNLINILCKNFLLWIFQCQNWRLLSLHLNLHATSGQQEPWVLMEKSIQLRFYQVIKCNVSFSWNQTCNEYIVKTEWIANSKYIPFWQFWQIQNTELLVSWK